MNKRMNVMGNLLRILPPEFFIKENNWKPVLELPFQTHHPAWLNHTEKNPNQIFDLT